MDQDLICIFMFVFLCFITFCLFLYIKTRKLKQNKKGKTQLQPQESLLYHKRKYNSHNFEFRGKIACGGVKGVLKLWSHT